MGRGFWVMSREGVAAVVAGVSLAAADMAVAQGSAVFPESLDRGPLLVWLQGQTDIRPERVVAVTPQALTAVVSRSPATSGVGPRLVIRAEALSAETYARTGALSWYVSMNADCASRKVQLSETTGYAGRNLAGARRELRATDRAWRTPDTGTALEAAWQLACEPDFSGPFQTAAVKVAQTDRPAPPAPEPRAETPAPSPAGPAKSPKPRARSGILVQVGASSSDSGARALLSELGQRLGERNGWVETAEVDGKTWRRAVVGGFADAAEAGRFCAGLKAEGRPCFVRAAARPN